MPVADNLPVVGGPEPPDMQVDRDSRERRIEDCRMPIRDSRAAIRELGSEAEELRRRGRALREGTMVPATLAARPSKRGPEDQGDREAARRAGLPRL